jgi:ABC-type antimicrobial peptide transport system permease subunit
MRDVVAEATSGARFVLVLLASFAAIALALAAVGIYGVMSYVVAERRHEIGIRLALGATPRQVLARVVLQGMSVAGAGLLAGLGAAAMLTGVMTGLVSGVPVMDPVTFAIVPATLALVSFAACYLPARRASQVDPLREIRG